MNGSVVQQRVLENLDRGFGYNAATDKYEDLMQAGIIDPTKVRPLPERMLRYRLRYTCLPISVGHGWESARPLNLHHAVVKQYFCMEQRGGWYTQAFRSACFNSVEPS